MGAACSSSGKKKKDKKKRNSGDDSSDSDGSRSKERRYSCSSHRSAVEFMMKSDQQNTNSDSSASNASPSASFDQDGATVVAANGGGDGNENKLNNIAYPLRPGPLLFANRSSAAVANARKEKQEQQQQLLQDDQLKEFGQDQQHHPARHQPVIAFMGVSNDSNNLESSENVKTPEFPSLTSGNGFAPPSIAGTEAPNDTGGSRRPSEFDDGGSQLFTPTNNSGSSHAMKRENSNVQPNLKRFLSTTMKSPNVPGVNKKFMSPINQNDHQTDLDQMMYDNSHENSKVNDEDDCSADNMFDNSSNGSTPLRASSTHEINKGNLLERNDSSSLVLPSAVVRSDGDREQGQQRRLRSNRGDVDETNSVTDSGSGGSPDDQSSVLGGGRGQVATAGPSSPNNSNSQPTSSVHGTYHLPVAIQNL